MRLRQGLLAASAAAVLAFAPGVQAKTFKWAFQGDVQTMDPHGLFETMTLGFQANIYEGLVARDKDMNLIPALASSWENIEPTVWRFTLRQGVKFQNGNAFTADDVVFSVERIRSEGSDMKVVANLIKETRKVDDFTVDLVTDQPNPILPDQLGIFYVMDKEWAGRAQHLHRDQREGRRGRQLRQPERQRHRPLHAEGAAAGREDRAGAQPQLVGQDGQQRHRGRLYAGRPGCDPGRGPDRRRRAHGLSGAGAGLGPPGRGRRRQAADRSGSAHHLPGLRPGP